MRQRLTAKIDEQLIRDLTRAGKSASCYPLAQLANELCNLHSTVRDEILNMSLGSDGLVPAIAKQVYDRLVPQARLDQLTQVAHALRILGIYLCAGLGRPLLSCPCLQALTKETRREQIDLVVERQLERAGI